MGSPSFNEVVERILEKDSRYHPLAYVFVAQALGRAQTQKTPKPEEKTRHVTGEELLESLRLHAVDTFGTAARNNLGEWGIRSCRDVGEIVFNMVEHGLVGKTEQDSRTDFESGYDFAKVFPIPFYRNFCFLLLFGITVVVILMALLRGCN